MTGQISDSIVYQRKHFDVCDISHNGGLFVPERYGLQTRGVCSACWHGYRVSYAIKNDRLVVEDLFASVYSNDQNQNQAISGPVINGQAPKPIDTMFNNEYKALNLRLYFSGGILIGRDFIDELYRHSGFQSYWKYKTVYELVFSRGVLKAVFDRTELVKYLRSEREHYYKEVSTEWLDEMGRKVKSGEEGMVYRYGDEWDRLDIEMFLEALY